jgi:hypothetical protein
MTTYLINHRLTAPNLRDVNYQVEDKGDVLEQRFVHNRRQYPLARHSLADEHPTPAQKWLVAHLEEEVVTHFAILGEQFTRHHHMERFPATAELVREALHTKGTYFMFDAPVETHPEMRAPGDPAVAPELVFDDMRLLSCFRAKHPPEPGSPEAVLENAKATLHLLARAVPRNPDLAEPLGRLDDAVREMETNWRAALDRTAEGAGPTARGKGKIIANEALAGFVRGEFFQLGEVFTEVRDGLGSDFAPLAKALEGNIGELNSVLTTGALNEALKVGRKIT